MTILNPKVPWCLTREPLDDTGDLTALGKTHVDCKTLTALPRDKWILASLLQKSVRRGQSRLATATAMALSQIDPPYVLRRLPVIAYEDIGVANPPLLLAVKQASQDLRSAHPEHLAQSVGGLASQLAASTKSRTACDILSLISVSESPPQFGRSSSGGRRPDLVALAKDRDAALIDRATAFRRLYLTRSNSSPSAEDASLSVAATMGAPKEVLAAMVSGGGTHGLNVFLPLAYEVAFMSGRVRTTNRPMLDDYEASSPFLLCALDMYTRVGRSAYRSLLETEPKLQELLRQHLIAANRVEAIGMLLFHAEGSLLDRAVISRASQALLADTEHAEERACGFRTRNGAQLVRRWMLYHADRVAAARRMAFASAAIPNLPHEAQR